MEELEYLPSRSVPAGAKILGILTLLVAVVSALSLRNPRYANSF
jgi:hypothetical protein